MAYSECLQRRARIIKNRYFATACHGVTLHPVKNADYPMKTTKTILSMALAVYFLLAFLCVLMTYFGVNLFLGGMHAYA